MPSNKINYKNHWLYQAHPLDKVVIPRIYIESSQPQLETATTQVNNNESDVEYILHKCVSRRGSAVYRVKLVDGNILIVRPNELRKRYLSMIEDFELYLFEKKDPQRKRRY